MGTGASARQSSSDGSAKLKGRDCDSSDLSTEDGSVSMQWLLSSIEQERREKEWLARKYDEKCEEMRLIKEEIRQLRGIEARPEPSTANLPSVAARTTSGSLSLAKRRSIDLKVGTQVKMNGQTTQQQEEARSPRTAALAKVAILHQASDDDQPSRWPSETVPVNVETTSAQVEVPSRPETDTQEPSAMLMRRVTSVDSSDSAASPVAHISTEKVFSMVDDPDHEPLSPKRRHRGKKDADQDHF